MSNTLTTLEKGKVFIETEIAIPLYHLSNFYVRGAKVIPDNTHWHLALRDGGNVAIHNSELYLAVLCIDENGNSILAIKNEYPYIRATSRRGDKFFTSEASAENANFKFSFRLSRFHDATDSEFYGDEKLLGYHTSAQRIDRDKILKFHHESDEYLLGIEVEKTDYEKQQDGDAWELLQNTGWSKEQDSSLGSGGYELVSPILPLFDIDRINRAVEPVRKWVNGKSNDRCGGHLTISNTKMNGDDLLDSFKDFAPIIYALYPNRISNNYCKAKNWAKYKSYPEKYSAFYLKDGSQLGGRVEIRIFSRITNQRTMNWRIELLQSLIKDKGNLNQYAQRIGCPESSLYKHFAQTYTHEQIGDKLRLIDEYSKTYGTHRNGISPSVKKRINNTMGYTVFFGV